MNRTAELARTRRPLAILLLAATAPLATSHANAQDLPAPEDSGIEHIIVVMMENRSFDHFLGWLPGADGRQEDVTYLDANGTPFETFRLTPDYQGCQYEGPDHSYEGGRIELNDGACDGWLLVNDEFSIGYYKRSDLRFFARAARDWTVCDRYFCSIMAETWPNKIYAYAGQTDRLENEVKLCTLPTIWDRLADAGLEGRYYFSDVPFVSMWGLRYLPISRPFETFLDDAEAGELPAVSFIDPRFLGEAQGLSNDDHPFADVRNGQVFMERIYRAVTTSPDWGSSVLVFTYDEWGGFFDHVPPPLREIPPADQEVGNDGRLGFRVPCIVVSPFAGAKVSSLELEHSSILRMIEWRWNLEPLTIRDANANNLAEVLDFSLDRSVARQYRMDEGPYGAPCPDAEEEIEWVLLLELARLLGWLL
jgi:phospholipase C